MIFKFIHHSAFLIVICFLSPIRAQSSNCDLPCFNLKRLTLRDAIVLALRQNPQIRSAELQRIVDKYALEVARNQFWPQYSFDTSATYSNGTKAFYSTNPKATLQTPYGSTVSFGMMDQVNAGRETAAFVQVTQPLLRGFGPQVARSSYVTACDQEIINRLNFEDTLSTTITNVAQIYYKLVQDQNNLKIDQISLEEALKLYHATELRIKAGKIAGTELIQQQAQIATSKMALTREQNTLAQDYRSFLILLGLDPRSNLQIFSGIDIHKTTLPCEEQAIDLALHKNIDYRRSLITLKQLEQAVLLAKDEQKWQLDLIGRAQQQILRNKNFATVDINQIDAIGNDLPGSDRTLILNLNIPIHDLSRKQKLVRTKVVLQQFKIALETQRQQLIAAVLNTLQSLNTQANQIQLAQDAVHFSLQSLDVAQKKFLYGRTTMFEVTSLQKGLTLQQIGLISEQISYLNNIADFEKLLGITLERWSITLCH